MSGKYRILAVNPGSTSTKVAVFEDDKEALSVNVSHDTAKLKEFAEIQDQLPYRVETIEKVLEESGVDIKSIAVFVGRGGGLAPVPGGTYEVNSALLADAAAARSGAPHPAQLASQICASYVKKYGGRAFVVNPPDVDEYAELSRITGLEGLYRPSHIHALNQKEVGLRYAAKVDKPYEELNLIIAHIGGGISVAAHQKGKMIDSNDLLGGEGPMMPSRSGALPAVPIVKLCFSGKYKEKEILDRINKTGGLTDHLGTADVIEIQKRIENGDKYAELIYDAMIYQIAKSIGSCACSLKGRVDAIILTGGISNSVYLTNRLVEYTGWIATVEVMAGEFEMEALAAGALRVMRGMEDGKVYTGVPVWTPPRN
jgi:butyrate kinase